MMRGVTVVGLRRAASLAVVSASKTPNRSLLFCPRYDKGSASSKSNGRMSSYSSLFTKNNGASPSASSSSSSSSSSSRRFARASDFTRPQTSSSFSSSSFSSSLCTRRGSLSVRKSNTNDASKDAQIWIDSWKTGGGGGGASSGGGFGGGGGGGGGSNSGGGGGNGSSKATNLWAMYLLLLESNPLATKMWTSGALNAFGDLLAQFLFEDGKSVDVKRTLTFTFLGAFLVGPALHFWYGILGKIVTVGGSIGAGVRLGLDQLAFAPVFLATFLSALFAIEGNTDKLPNKLKQDLFPTVVANWKIWVPFQFLNFRFVPANLQVGAANVIALAWNVYLSWASHKKVPEVVIEGKNTKKKGSKR